MWVAEGERGRTSGWCDRRVFIKEPLTDNQWRVDRSCWTRFESHPQRQIRTEAGHLLVDPFCKCRRGGGLICQLSS